MPSSRRSSELHAVGEIAQLQSGLVTTGQAMAVGLTPAQIDHHLRSRDLERVAPRVYAMRGVALTDLALLQGALLEAAGRSAVCRHSAAALWRFPGFTLRPFHIARLRDGTFPRGILGAVHTTRRLPDQHITDFQGLTVTTPTRTLFDLAGVMHPMRVERLVDHAWAHKQTSWPLLHRTFDEMRGRGQSGIAAMREILDARGEEYRPPESGLEARCAQILRDHSITGFERQIELGDEHGVIGRVDFAHRECRIIIEVDSDLHHTSLSDRRDDERRQARLEAQGWVIVRVTEFEVWHRSDVVIAKVRAVMPRGTSRRRRSVNR